MLNYPVLSRKNHHGISAAGLKKYSPAQNKKKREALVHRHARLFKTMAKDFRTPNLHGKPR